MRTDMQDKLFELYKEIDAICREHNIEYQLAGGTLIGAIRHRGFIPWDDDMDITMTRKHWNKFLQVCNNGALPKNRALECQQNNRGYHNMVARYTDTTTTALHKTQLMHDDIAGYVIDILVYDALPNTGEALEKYTQNLMLYSDLLNESLIYSYRYRINAFRYLKSRLMIRLKGKDYVLKKLEQEMSQYNEDECDYLVLHWGGIPLVFDKKTFGESRVNIPIDGTMGQCPDRPFDYLVDHYGDEWMFIPPVTEQQSHEAVFNTEIPFPVIRGEMYHFVSQKKVKRNYRKRKNITITHMNRWQNLKDMGNKINVIAQNLESSQSLRDRYEEIQKYKEEKNYPALREIFDEIVNIQNARNIAGRGDYSGAYRYFRPILMDIPKEMFEIMLETLFNTGSTSIAKRFIEIYEYNKDEKTAYMAELEQDIFKFRKAVSHFASKECEESLPLINELFEKYPKNVPVLKLKLSFLSKETDFNESKDEIKSLAERGLSLYPEDGDFIKFLLDTQLENNREETLLGYIDAWYKTYNGLIKLDIVDIIQENLSFYLDYCQSLAKDKKAQEALDLITKLEEILQDNADVYDCKFRVLKTRAENANTTAKKAKRQFELIQSILSLREKYINKFRKNEFSEIENLITKWYYKYYKSINHSAFVTLTSAEILACEDYNEIGEILRRIEEYMEKCDSKSEEYLYCLQLKGDALYYLGNTNEAYRIYIECLNSASDPYLLNILNAKFISSLTEICRDLTAIYNGGFTHKILENIGLDKEEATLKSMNNKKRLITDYKDRMAQIYPNAMTLINIFVKTGALSKNRTSKFIAKYKINEDTKLNNKIITGLYKTLVNKEITFDEDICYMEELNEKDFNLDHQGHNDKSVFDF